MIGLRLQSFTIVLLSGKYVSLVITDLPLLVAITANDRQTNNDTLVAMSSSIRTLSCTRLMLLISDIRPVGESLLLIDFTHAHID